MISFPATDIEYALQAEIDSLKEQEKYLRQSLRDANRLLQQRAETIMVWAKRAIEAERKLAAVGKEWGRIQSENSYPIEDYTRYAI
jgi:predicted  nucleic acid-binding Zn-ribbon protein